MNLVGRFVSLLTALLVLNGSKAEA